MKKGYITILDIQNDQTHIFQFYLSDDASLEEYLLNKGFDIDKIYFMITDTINLNIQ
jgi:hypothetical protein